MVRQHHVKSWRPYFAEAVSGVKTFDVRDDGRGFEVGDVLVLREWDPRQQTYSGASHARRIVYVLRGMDAELFGLREGYVVLGLGDEVAI